MPSMLRKFRSIFESAPVAILEIDFTPLRDLQRKLQKQTVTNLRNYLAEHPQVVITTFKQVKIREANGVAYHLCGVKSRKELSGHFIKIFLKSGSDLLVEQFVALLEGEREFAGEFRVRSGRGIVQDIFLRSAVLKSGGDSFARVIVALQDITPWKRIERQLRKRAQLDGLTQLLNHNTIMQRLDEELIRAKRYGLSLSCMMIDLDHFKIVNDKFGHQRGDVVLKRVASMIKNCVRKVDVVGRYGGDEFLILLPETPSRLARYAAQRVQRLFLAKIFKYQKIITFHVSLSIGICGYPSKKIKESKDMVALADKAMYIAKKAGRNRITVI